VLRDGLLTEVLTPAANTEDHDDDRRDL
jgi:hypothetical protein